MTTDVDLAWAAGFLDGEGSILIAKGRTNVTATYYSLQLNAAQVDPVPLHKLQEMFGGSVFLSKAGNGNQSPIHRWTVAARIAERALTDLVPYLVVKRREARVALRYLRYKATPGLSHRGEEQPRNERYKRLLEQCRLERKVQAWRRVA